jgi:hypothetical protein
MSDDMLEKAFERQVAFMEQLRQADRMPEWPVDLRTKSGQRLLKEVFFSMMEEVFEASYTLKNRSHRLTDDRSVDMDHFLEELGDAFAFFLEACILAGFGPHDLFNEYCRKNSIVKARLQNGY